MPAVPRPGLRVTPALTIPTAELTWRFSRASGPRGQGVNTADSRVELSWDVAGSAVLTESQRAQLLERLENRVSGGVLTVVASERRAQLANREAALGRLAALVRGALAPPSPPRRPTRPTRGATERRLQAKKIRSGTKQLRRKPTE